MAEVQRRLEALTVELEELTRLGFFSDEECTSLVKKQFEFENKINSMNKSVQDFKEYIAYVVALYRIIKIRRNKVKIGDKKHHLEYRVLQRVRNLYEMAAMRFPQEVELYFAFFQICKEANFQHATNKMCDMMLKHHKNNPEVWLSAAALYFHEKNDSSKAIKLLQQGIGIINSCSELYTECIHFEVYAVVISQTVSKASSEIQNENIAKLIAKLEVYIKQAKQHIDDYKFYADLLTFLMKFDFSISIQVGLIAYLMDSYADCADSWHYLATRELEGAHYDVEQQNITIVDGKNTFLNAISVYEKGLSVICQENRQSLWDFLINCVVDFKNSNHFEKVSNYSRLALAAFERAAGDNCLSDQFYLHYLELVHDEKKIELLNQANERLPKSVDLWALRLRIDIARNVHEDILNTFANACKSLSQDALPLWEIMHSYLLDSHNAEDLKKFYLSAIQQGGVIMEQFKSKYINWLGSVSMDACRDAYALLLSKHFDVDSYKTMLKLEEKEMKMSKNKTMSLVNLESVHKTACRRFGHDNVDVWINYVSFLLRNQPITLAKGAIAQVAVEVRRKLDDDLLDEFEARYDVTMQTSKTKGLKRKSVHA